MSPEDKSFFWPHGKKSGDMVKREVGIASRQGCNDMRHAAAGYAPWYSCLWFGKTKKSLRYSGCLLLRIILKIDP
jgi:hypothetical protein